MCTSKLKIETKALIVATQDRALRTWAYNCTILWVHVSPSCLLCNGANETTFYLLSACPYLAGTQYVQKHNSVASLLHRMICTHYGFHPYEKPRLCVPQPVVDSMDVNFVFCTKL